MGDRGVGQQALDVVLQQGEQVAGDHRGGGDDGEDEPHRVVRREAHVAEVAQQQGEHGALGDGGHEGRHRRRRALVDVGRPHVERHDAELEADADDDQGEAADQQRGLGRRRR